MDGWIPPPRTVHTAAVHLPALSHEPVPRRLPSHEPVPPWMDCPPGPPSVLPSDAAPMVRRRKMRLNILCSEPNTVIRASIGVCTVGLVVCGRTGGIWCLGMNDDDDDDDAPAQQRHIGCGPFFWALLFCTLMYI